jgi:hypothetical protein
MVVIYVIFLAIGSPVQETLIIPLGQVVVRSAAPFLLPYQSVHTDFVCVLIQCIASELVWLHIARGRACPRESAVFSEFVVAEVFAGNGTIESG